MEDEKQYGDWAFPCNITYEDEDGKQHTVTRVVFHGSTTPQQFDYFYKQFIRTIKEKE